MGWSPEVVPALVLRRDKGWSNPKGLRGRKRQEAQPLPRTPRRADQIIKTRNAAIWNRPRSDYAEHSREQTPPRRAPSPPRRGGDSPEPPPIYEDFPRCAPRALPTGNR